MKRLIGVDEAGRAPLAGPVSVAAVMVPEGFDILKEFPGVKDSKLLAPKKREALYKEALARSKAGEIRFCVRFSDRSYIDEFGITRAVRRAVARCVVAVAPSAEGVRVFLDGLLYAPSRYEQETIINGDALVPIISLASVLAKVKRDELMRKYGRMFPDYGFEVHKGYGAKRHREAIRKFGLCAIHRITYSQRFAIL